MKITELVETLNRKEISLRMEAGNLKVRAGKGKIDREIIEHIKSNKNGLIKLLFTEKATSSAIPVAPKQERYDLTPSQYRLWVASNLGAKKAYNIPFTTELHGTLERENLAKAMQEVIKRHDSVRTVFRLDETNTISQYIIDYEDFKVEFEYADHVGVDQSVTDEFVQGIIGNNFDLETGPLLRTGVIRVEPEKHILFVCIHHLVSDGWSMEIVFNDLIKNYISFCKNGVAEELEPLSIQYSDYSLWFNKNLEEINKLESSFWVDMFREKLPLLELPFERDRPAKRTYNGATVQHTNSVEWTAKFNAFCGKLNVTAFSVISIGLKILFSKYTGLEDITIGSPISGRINSQLEDQIGLYINTIPVRSRFSKENSFKELMINEHEMIKKCHDNQLFSMEALLEKLEIEAHAGHSPLFDILIASQNQTDLGMYDATVIPNLTVKPEPGSGPNVPFTQFEIGMGVGEYEDELIVSIQYNTDVYERTHIKRMVADYIFLLESMMAYPEEKANTFFDTSKYAFMTDEPIVFTEVVQKRTAEVREAANTGPVSVELKNDLLAIMGSYVESLTEDQDYFEIGGNSLGAIQSVNDINKKYKTKLSIVDFYTNPTVNLLHNFLYEKYADLMPEAEESGAVAEAVSDTVPAASSTGGVVVDFGKIDEEKSNLFLFPPIIGASLVFRSLARLEGVKENYNCFGIDIPIIDQQEDLAMEVSRLLYAGVAEKITKENDTVYLLGYSVGVHWAYEVGRMLEADGHQVKLVLVDRGPEMEEDYDLTDDFVNTLMESHKPLLEQLILVGGDSVEVVEKRVRQTLLAMKDYQVEGKNNSPIVSFESKENGFNGYMEKWKKYTNGNHELHSLEGNHFEALSPENMAKISQTLKKLYK